MVASMSSLLHIFDRAQGNSLFVEEYLARQGAGSGAEPANAPPVAGGAL